MANILLNTQLSFKDRKEIPSVQNKDEAKIGVTGKLRIPGGSARVCLLVGRG